MRRYYHGSDAVGKRTGALTNLIVMSTRTTGMLTDSNSLVPGRAFHLSDFHANIWEFMRPLLASQGLQAPSLSLPLAVGVALGVVLDVLQTTWYYATGRTWPSLQPTK